MAHDLAEDGAANGHFSPLQQEGKRIEDTVLFVLPLAASVLERKSLILAGHQCVPPRPNSICSNIADLQTGRGGKLPDNILIVSAPTAWNRRH